MHKILEFENLGTWKMFRFERNIKNPVIRRDFRDVCFSKPWNQTLGKN